MRRDGSGCSGLWGAIGVPGQGETRGGCRERPPRPPRPPLWPEAVVQVEVAPAVPKPPSPDARVDPASPLARGVKPPRKGAVEQVAREGGLEVVRVTVEVAHGVGGVDR